MANTTLSTVKTDLGITNNNKDAVIQTAINCALIELEQAGVDTVTHASDEYVLGAIIMYCRGDRNFQGESDMWFARFEEMKQRMSRTGKYAHQEEPEGDPDEE